MKNYPENIDVSKAEEAGIRFYASGDEQEAVYLNEALQRTDEEKFLFLTKLMKMGQQMNKATFIEK